MRTFRAFLRGPWGKTATFATIVAAFYSFSEPQTYLYALEQQRQKEDQIRAIARNLNVDPEFLLHPNGRRGLDIAGVFKSIAQSFHLAAPEENAQQPLDARQAIAAVKSRYALVGADTVLTNLAAAVDLAGRGAAQRSKHAKTSKGRLESVARLIDRDLLPAVGDDLPPIAHQRDRDMRGAVDQIRHQIKPILNRPGALDDANVDATLAEVRAAIGGILVPHVPSPRWTRDPLPLKDTYRAAPVRASNRSYANGAAPAASSTPAVIANAFAPSSKTHTPSARAVPTAVSALAAQLATPAKAFTYVHDRVGWEPYGGVAKGSLGTLSELRGNDWDQALLLRDLLTAQGYQAQIEWGTVTIPIAQAMNLVGTEDPLQAANLLATAGFDGVVNTTNNTPVSVQMTHAWVRAFLPYMPNRGATNGTADTWVRMDPSFKRYDYQAGIAINGKVPWSEDQYLQTSAPRLPTDFYSDKIWDYIRSHNLNCDNLGLVSKSGTPHAENFPFIPSTLTVRIESVAGVAADAPSTQIHRVTLALKDANNATAATYAAAIPDLWGKKLSLTFVPATPDDAAIINANGGLFSTPAYLVQLKPVFSLDDVAVATGSAVPAGAALDLALTFQQPNVPDDFTRHDVIAGETHTVVFDPGAVLDSAVSARLTKMQQLAATGAPADAVLTEKLFVVGLRYMQHVDDAVAFAAGVRWQRSVKRVFEADVRQQVDVRYSVAGTALRLVPAEQNIDVSRLVVGIIPINNDLSNRAEVLSLAGLDSSYLEGAIWEEVESQQGISAAKALLLSRMAGQALYTVDSGNVESVLATVDLPPDVESEIRGAVAQGRIAKVPAAAIDVNHWHGTGYILRDPLTGAATYPISGGMAGGSTTGEEVQGIKELLGSESWLSDSPLGDLLRQLLGLLGGGDSSGGPSTTQSDPVNMSSGNMVRSATDLSVVARGIPVAVTRTYNSRSTYNGPFGYGWTFNYDERLVANDDGSITYREADGTEHRFVNFVSPPGKHLTLTQTGGGYTLHFKDGLQFSFDSRGLLVAQTDLNGNTVTINRDAAGFPTTVVDAAGRTVLTFTVTGGKITAVTDLFPRTVSYTYDGDDLVSVTDTAGKIWRYGYLAHNMTSMTDPLGNKQSYDYDADDRLFHHTDATGAEEFFHYDPGARQAVVTDRRGGDRLIGYDESGRATMEVDPAGNLVKATFDADNNRTSTLDSRGSTTSYEYDASGNVTKQTSPDGGVTTTTYDASSRPLVQSDPSGLVTSNVYDTHGNLTTSTRAVGGVSETTTNTYDGSGQLLSTTDPNNGTSSMSWNANGTIATRTDAANQTTTMGTDALGRITSIKDPLQNETRLTYDNKDRIATMTDPYTNTTSFGYDDAGRRTTVTTPRGITRYAYDAEGRVTSVTDVLGNVSKTVYDAAGEVTQRIDARGNITRYEYDTIGRVTKMTDGNGGVWSYGYCAAVGGGGGGASCSSCGGGGGSFCLLTDPNGNTIKQEFDLMGRVTSVTDSLSHSSFTEYDKAGRKTAETDANGNATRYGYDEAGRLLRVTEASGAVTSYTYDKAGNKLTQKDANGHTWSFRYDALNRMIEETDSLLRKSSYVYDELGNLKSKTDGKNQTIQYSYTVRRLTKITYPDGTSDNFTYDTKGRRTSQSNASVTLNYTYDDLNRVLSVTNPTFNVSLRYEYDAAGNQSKLTAPNSVTTYIYDGKNRLSSISDSVTGQYRLTYDAMDRRTELRYPNGLTTSYSYDNAYRLTAMVSKSAGGTVLDAWSYGYDAVGNRISKTDAQGRIDHYAYDAVYRLTEAQYGDGARESFTYDAVGNRTSRTDEAGVVTSYSYDVANQMTSAGGVSYTYDGNGNVTAKGTAATYTYDFNNRLKTISGSEGSETSTYAPDGTRFAITGNQNRNFSAILYDRSGNPVWERSGGTAGVARVYGPGVDEVLAEWRPGFGLDQLRYLHHDALGSITCATNTFGVVEYTRTYRAFGQMSGTGDIDGLATSRLGYTGREISVGSLMQYRSRWYDSGTGRFLQQDTYEGSVASPPSLHRYVYSVNNPVRYIDPAGTNPVLAAFGIPLFVIAVTLYFAISIGILREFAEDNRPGVRADQKVCLGYVKGLAMWALLFPFAAVGAWLISMAIMYFAYVMGVMLEIFPVLAAFIWVIATNHEIFEGMLFAILLKIGIDLVLEYLFEEWDAGREFLDRGADALCGVR